MIYTAWGKDGHADCLVAGADKPHSADGPLFDDAHELIWTIEADCWEDAMQEYYDLQGWGIYKPLEPDKQQ